MAHIRLASPEETPAYCCVVLILCARDGEDSFPGHWQRVEVYFDQMGPRLFVDNEEIH